MFHVYGTKERSSEFSQVKLTFLKIFKTQLQTHFLSFNRMKLI